MNEITHQIVKPEEREVVKSKKIGGRASKSARLMEIAGGVILEDLVLRGGGLRASGRRVADWGNQNGIPMTDNTGIRAVKKLVIEGKLKVVSRVEKGVAINRVSLP